MTELVAKVGKDLIALLIEKGDHLFDPVRFRYIESMSRRAIKQRTSVSLILEQKIQQTISNYQADLFAAREHAAEVVKQSAIQFPEASDQLQCLFQNSDFAGINALVDKLNRGRSRHLLSELLKQLLLEIAGQGAQLNESSFSNLLQQQEKELTISFHEKELRSNPIKKELKSVRLFRESQEQLNSDKLVRRAIKEGPENPGPINPHMLAIRSLSTMQSLSPHYLKRFVSYIDTIFWLEEAGDIIKPVNAKK